MRACSLWCHRLVCDPRLIFPLFFLYSIVFLRGGGTLIFSYIRRLRSFFGFKILKINIFDFFLEKIIIFGVQIFCGYSLGLSQNWTIFSGHFYAC